MTITSVMHTVDGCLYVESVCVCVHVCLKKQDAPRPYEHPQFCCLHIQICGRVHRDWCFEAFVDVKIPGAGHDLLSSAAGTPRYVQLKRLR